MKFKPFTYHAGLCPAHPEEHAGSNDGGSTLAVCLLCSDEKQRAENRALQEAQSEARKVREIESRVEACRIPYRFSGKSFSDYSADSLSQRTNMEKCQQYASDFADHYEYGRCLILSGTVGTGKTHLAIAILRDAVEKQGFTGKYWTVNGLLQTIRSTYDKQSDFSEAEVMNSITCTDLLVLDEVGATKQSEFEMATLFNIINSRYEQQIPTIVISNLGPKQIGEALGERCFDRLREGGGECLVFQGESNRKQK
jgi:DNA replication protein DnaC